MEYSVALINRIAINSVVILFLFLSHSGMLYLNRSCYLNCYVCVSLLRRAGLSFREESLCRIWHHKEACCNTGLEGTAWPFIYLHPHMDQLVFFYLSLAVAISSFSFYLLFPLHITFLSFSISLFLFLKFMVGEEEPWGTMANGYRISFGNDENVLTLTMVMARWLWVYKKKNCKW